MNIKPMPPLWIISLGLSFLAVSNAAATPIPLDPSPLVLEPTAQDDEWFVTLLEPLDPQDLALTFRVTSGDLRCSLSGTEEWCSLLAVAYRGGGSGAMVLDVSDPSYPMCTSGCLELGVDVASNTVMLIYEPGPLDLLLRFALADPAVTLIGNSIVFSRTSRDGSVVEATGTFAAPEPGTLGLFFGGVIGLGLARFRGPRRSSCDQSKGSPALGP